MKKEITILAIIMIASIGAFAQFNQGRMLVGGSAELSTNADKNRNNGTTVTTGNRTSFTLSPDFGYFVIDNLAVGAELSVGLSKWNAKTANGTDNSTTSVQFQPFVRYYLPIPIFFQGKVGLGTSKTSYDENFADYKYNTTSLSLSAGYAIFLTDNVALEPELGYRTTRYKGSDSNTKNIDSGIFLRIGFQIYLGNK